MIELEAATFVFRNISSNCGFLFTSDIYSSNAVRKNIYVYYYEYNFIMLRYYFKVWHPDRNLNLH